MEGLHYALKAKPVSCTLLLLIIGTTYVSIPWIWGLVRFSCWKHREDRNFWCNACTALWILALGRFWIWYISLGLCAWTLGVQPLYLSGEIVELLGIWGLSGRSRYLDAALWRWWPTCDSGSSSLLRGAQALPTPTMISTQPWQTETLLHSWVKRNPSLLTDRYCVKVKRKVTDWGQHHF